MGQYWPCPRSREVLFETALFLLFSSALIVGQAVQSQGESRLAALSSQEAQFLLKNQSIYRLLLFLLWTNKFVAMLARDLSSLSTLFAGHFRLDVGDTELEAHICWRNTLPLGSLQPTDIRGNS